MWIVESKELVDFRVVEIHIALPFTICIDEYYLLGDNFGQDAG